LHFNFFKGISSFFYSYFASFFFSFCVFNNMLNMLSVSPYLQGTVKGLVIIAAVFLQRGSAARNRV